ncbi:hypothetical protein [Runella sp.]|uniref:hypothetical protein n=1 Tax=Runella sp. TaxID=1960881 RepID=UPI0026336211|nr:hypothetical protein [Runella sp.]
MNQDLLSQIQRYLTKSFFVPLKAIEPDLSFRKLALSAAEFMEIVLCWKPKTTSLCLI